MMAIVVALSGFELFASFQHGSFPKTGQSLVLEDMSLGINR